MQMDRTVNVGDEFSDEIETPSCHILLYVVLPTPVGSPSAYKAIPHSFELFLLSFWLVLKCFKLCYFRVFLFIFFILRQDLPKFFRLDFSLFCKKNFNLRSTCLHVPSSWDAKPEALGRSIIVH